MDYLFVVRILIAMFIGFWLARRFRVNIRGLVVRLMPLKYRMSERSFYLQSRISTALAFIIALGVGFIVNEGLSYAFQWADIPGISYTEGAAIFTPSFPEEPALSDLQNEPIPDSYSSPGTEQPTTLTEQHSPQKLPVPNPPTIASANYYLQTSAFANGTYARSYLKELQRSFPNKTHLAITDDHICPYKILLGPFQNRNQAIGFRKRYQLDGFPRKIEPRFIVQ